MKQHPDILLYARILTIRKQLVKAYEQNDLERLYSLSREMDEIQLRHWKGGILQPQEG